jgi:hypothetical protein
MNRALPRMRLGHTTEFQLGGEPATLTATAKADGRLSLDPPMNVDGWRRAYIESAP